MHPDSALVEPTPPLKATVSIPHSVYGVAQSGFWSSHDGAPMMNTFSARSYRPFPIVDRVARGLLMVVVGEGVADRLGTAVTAVPVVDYPITHLVLAWPADQAHAQRAELVRTAQGLVSHGPPYGASFGDPGTRSRGVGSC